MAVVREVQKKNIAEGKPAPALKPGADLKVKSRFVRLPPDKIRYVGKEIGGKKIQEALNILAFIPKAAAKPLELVLKQAISAAKDKDLEIENLYIKTLAVDEGPKLKRRRIISRGRATTILKRMSHITVVLSADGNHKSPPKADQPRADKITNSMPKGKQIANKQKTKFKK